MYNLWSQNVQLLKKKCFASYLLLVYLLLNKWNSSKHPISIKLTKGSISMYLFWECYIVFFKNFFFSFFFVFFSFFLKYELPFGLLSIEYICIYIKWCLPVYIVYTYTIPVYVTYSEWQNSLTTIWLSLWVLWKIPAQIFNSWHQGICK